MRTTERGAVRIRVAGAAAAVAAMLATVVLPAAGAAAPAAASPATALPAVPEVSATTRSAAVDPEGPTERTLAWRAEQRRRVVVGESVKGRTIVARRLGARTAPYVLLVIGQMHGDEPKGRAVVSALRRLEAPRDVQIWTISTMNPDGARARSRYNSRGVDLNRNFPHQWRRNATAYNAGRFAASERETRVMMRFLNRLRPDLILSLHQAYRSIDDGNPKTHEWVHRIAPVFRLPVVTVPCRGPCVGTMMGWYNATYVGYGVTVELPSSRAVTAKRAQRYARACVKVARLVRDSAASPA